jgi:hypothetical protein
MSFSSTLGVSTVFGDKVVKMGTYNAASVTSGTITTGLTHIEYFNLQSGGNATNPYASVSGGALSLTTASSDTGYWIAIGE